jgi:hypothetical protein
MTSAESEWALRAVGMDDGDLRPGLERDARTGGEAFVDFDGDDISPRAGKLGENGGVIARAATEMKDVVAGVDVEQAEVRGPKAGLAVIQALGRVEHDEGILIDVSGLVAFSEVLCAAGLNHPRTEANETFAGHGGEGAENSGRGDVVDAAQLFGVEEPRGFDRIGR